MRRLKVSGERKFENGRWEVGGILIPVCFWEISASFEGEVVLARETLPQVFVFRELKIFGARALVKGEKITVVNH